MTGQELRVALARLSIRQTAFAKIVGKREEAISRWINGKHPVPEWVEWRVQTMLSETSAES